MRKQLARIDFGVTISPFLLNCVICKHVQTYNFDTKFSNLSELTILQEELILLLFELFKKLKLHFWEGAFDLRKWRTNEPKLRKLSGIKLVEDFQSAKTLKTL